jgi:subtilisin family serine protease
MKTTRIALMAAVALLAAGQALAQPAGRGPGGGGGGGGNGGGGGSTSGPTLQSWMSQEVGDAWRQGYQGKGATITVIDDFNSNVGFYGNLTGSTELRRHGEWTLRQASLIAPQANMRSHEFTSGSAVSLARRSFNVLNLSYGMMAPAGYSTVNWSRQESSIIGYARDGRAVISKAAGNDSGTAVGQPNANGQLDYLNRDLIGAQSAIFVGALSTNGTTAAPATMASYSNIAGNNTTVQNQFLVVGVEGHKTGLYGTSFAAPIVSGYAAIVRSKFTRASPTEVANQLLNTARQDTISGYNPAIHGRGEASITRALAPSSIQ